MLFFGERVTAKRLCSHTFAFLMMLTQTVLLVRPTQEEDNSTLVDVLIYFGASMLAISLYVTGLRLNRSMLKISEDTNNAKRVDQVSRVFGIPGSVFIATAGTLSFKQYMTKSAGLSDSTSAYIAFSLLPFSAISQIAFLWSKHKRPEPFETQPGWLTKIFNWSKSVMGFIVALSVSIPNAFIFIEVLLMARAAIEPGGERIRLGESEALDALYYIIHTVVAIGGLPVQITYHRFISNMISYRASEIEEPIQNIISKLCSPLSISYAIAGTTIAISLLFNDFETIDEVKWPLSILLGILGAGPINISIFCCQQIKSNAKIEPIDAPESDEEEATSIVPVS